MEGPVSPPPPRMGIFWWTYLGMPKRPGCRYKLFARGSIDAVYGCQYCSSLLTLFAQYAVQGLCSGRMSVRPSVCLSSRSTSAACLSLGTSSRYRPITAGARAAAAGSVMLRAEVRGSTQACCRVFAKQTTSLRSGVSTVSWRTVFARRTWRCRCIRTEL